MFWTIALIGCGGDKTLPATETGDTAAPPPGTPIPTTTLTATTEVEPGFLDGEFCMVRGILEVGCTTGCHSALVPAGGLDLETDPWAAMVNQPALVGGTIVVPGDSVNSVLMHKMTGNLTPTEGRIMPPEGLLDPAFALFIRDWIDAGAVNDCQPGPPPPATTWTNPGTGGTEAHHPPGWSASGVHGLAAKLQTDGDCRSCHGADLAGGTTGVSCDDCHAPGWRTNCTFCHGGTENATGAPPVDMDGNPDPATISFPSHTAHVTQTIHAAYDCVQCHRKPADVLTPAHVFDDVTPGYGEMYYGGGLAPIATYANGTCSNVYCHGDGDAPGTGQVGQTYGCDGCHGFGAGQGLGGRHDDHLGEGILCSECHSTVVDAAGNLLNPALHVQGTKDVVAPSAPFNGATCTGNCHGENHNNRPW